MNDDDLKRLADSLENDLNSGYSETVLDHAMNPRNVGRLEDENGFSVFTGPCGDTMLIYLRIEGRTINDIRFWTDGCGTAIASGSMVTVLAKGKTIDDAAKISQDDVLEALDGLPEESAHCALLAATTLHMAIDDHLERSGGPENTGESDE